MPRATTKAELITSAKGQWDKLWQLIDSMDEETQNAPFHFGDNFLQAQKEAHWTRDNNLRDILIHLYEWHQLLLNWTTANLNGETQPFLPKPYNWRTYGQMNIGFWEKHQATPYEQAKSMLQESQAKVMTLIETFSDGELFEKKHFSWTGTSSLGSYCVSTTASHYDWAMKKIKQHIKTQG